MARSSDSMELFILSLVYCLDGMNSRVSSPAISKELCEWHARVMIFYATTEPPHQEAGSELNTLYSVSWCQNGHPAYISNTTLLYLWQYHIIISCRQNWLPRKTGQALGTFSILHKCETGRGDTFSLLEDAAHGAITMDMPDCFCYKVCHWKHRQLRETFVFWQQDWVRHYDFLKDASRKPFNCRRAAKQPCQYKDLSKH